MPTLPRENVQDYPRPPRLEPVSEEVLIVFAGREIVRTRRAMRVLETHHAPTYYIPPGEFRAELKPARGQSFCEWKGRAAYWDLVLDGQVAPRAGWSYPRPAPGFRDITDFVAVYSHAMDACSVGGMAVTPQPGDFYGGWVTENLDGIVKGGPGTLGW